MKALTLLLALLLVQDPAVERAKKVLEKSPDDPAANLTLAVHYAERGKWDVALPCFEKVKSEGIRAAVEAEKKVDGNQFTSIEIADAWVRAMSKAGPARQACLDRAGVHFAAAWPKLDQFGRVQTRERLGKLYAPTSPGRLSQEALAGWGGVQGAAARVEVAAQLVHSGGCALRFTPKDKTKGTLAHSKALPVIVGKKLEVSAWVLSDGTDSAADGLQFVVRDNKNGFSWTAGDKAQANLPVWVRVSGETVVPDGSVSVEVQINFDSKTGNLFVDDISIRLDGQELLRGGNFE